MRISALLLLGAFFAPIASAQQAKDAFGDPLPKGAIARIGTTRYRVTANENPPLLSPDGTLLAVPGKDVGLEIWEVPAWKKRLELGKNLAGDVLRYFSYAFTADSKTMVAYDGENGRIELIDLRTGKVRKKLSLAAERGFGPSSVLAISRDQKTLICGGNTAKNTMEVLVWDLVKDKLKHAITLLDSAQGPLGGFALSGDGKQLAHVYYVKPGMGMDGGNLPPSLIEFWNLETGKLIRKIDPVRPILQWAFSPDGKLLAICSDNPALRIYETATGKDLNIRLRRSDAHRAMAFAPDGQSLYLSEEDGRKISQWNALTWERITSFAVPTPCALEQLAFAPQGAMRGLCCVDKAIVLWDVANGKVLSPVGMPSSAVTNVSFTPAGELFVMCKADYASWWDPRTGRNKREQPLLGKDLGESAPQVYEVLVAPDGELCAYFTESFFSVHDTKTGKRLYDEKKDCLTGVAFFDQGKRIASIREETVCLWHSRSGRDYARFQVPLNRHEQPRRLAVSPDGKRFAINVCDPKQDRIVLWDNEQKKLLQEWSADGPARTMTFSLDSNWLAIGGPQAWLQLSRVGNGNRHVPLKVIEADLDVTDIVFSPDARQLACVLGAPLQAAAACTCAALEPAETDAGKIFIYEVASKKVRLVLPGHAGSVIHRLAYSHDGALLASGSADTTALVWRAGLRAFAELRNEPEASATAFAKMAGADAKAAFQAMIQLAQMPKEAVAILEQKIAPAEKPDTGGRTPAQWIDDLASANFAVRNKASAMLQRLGPDAENAVRAAAAKPRGLEVKRRLEELLERIATRELTAPEILQVRAVEVLEAIATPEARALLQRWSAGDDGAVLTEEAKRTLARLRGR
jgi:WD40 repeat protein